ncbi:tRNA (adenosine(37)-N6)-threonylcarbamoyltransferase complex dimerization subunit type 1 TsaB [Phaeobacter italicus]|uniref:tRNA (adenosine(37)-N6)-threonylcarbamoyltransferase complex dimerization subunit type 1 TsaB n=1 Tax=Phaeobacter italicus TaxID=481446 RepID=UPI001CD777B0|nr:tRNA (adenosine(37)-N6)-threonylcarbamoyltransferase complex dimerization subunit type 1 TsaB [Phaeobacter italicus]MCA0857393.1 tRNA (adenosine(37)-N6)-threonylcarbamoyltransferase complex dimerization subunit type 1 TsaB [Phaeobacter italicus]
MPSDALVLGFDTSAAHCAAALLRGDVILAECCEEMGRGQAERLMPLLEEVLSAGNAVWSDLDAIGVGIGPGNFTGIRIAVSAARGLALGLGIPAVGVDGFESREKTGTLAAVPAPREQVYTTPPGAAPQLMPRAEAEVIARDNGLTLVAEATPAGLAAAIARAAAGRYQSDATPPAPMYLRAADAAPAKDAPPSLIDG